VTLEVWRPGPQGVVASLALSAAVATACGGGREGPFELPTSEAAAYPTAYLAVVVADPAGDDLATGEGEHVVVRNNWDHRADLGGWWIEDADGHRLPLGVGRQLDPGAELEVHVACGDDGDEAVFACLDREVLDDDGEVLRLLDAGGGEVARFAYGTAGGDG
jgi:predicted small lipoprotein YifL